MRQAVFRQGLIGLAAVFLAGCAQTGLPSFPDPWGYPPQVSASLAVAYHPSSVMGLGHTAVIVTGDQPGRFLRFEQFASSEWDYGVRLTMGTDRFWQVVTSRLPPLMGLTRERVIRREGATLASLVDPGEITIPLEGTPQARQNILDAAQARFAVSQISESPSAKRYWLATNNCHHFTRQILAAGGVDAPRYFPKHQVEDWLKDFKAQQEKESSNLLPFAPGMGNPGWVGRLVHERDGARAGAR
ncbi:MAG: hypothetical protein OEW12_00745 [Deltaproteobacteria bacterium]|nr:hypothetical protein [Deltaproteobacteria bacterium]